MRCSGFLFLLLAVLLAAGPGAAFAQQGTGLGNLFEAPRGGEVTWAAEADPDAVEPGARFQVRLSGEIGEGWHVYAMDSPAGRPLGVALEAVPEGFTRAGEPTQSTPREGYDPNFDSDVRYFETRAEILVPLRVTPGASPGAYTIAGGVTYQACNDRLCLPPKTEPFAVAVRIGEGSAQAGGPPAIAPPGAAPEAGGEANAGGAEIGSGAPGGGSVVAPTRPEGAEAGGFWAFLLLAAGAGLAALLTPCVFPMIPLTVSYFTHHAGSRGRAVRMAFVYGAAIVITFTGLGVLTAVLVGATGAQTIAANPWINLFIGCVFVVFALSLLGLFELRLPSGLLSFVNRQSYDRRGYLGVWFMGLTLTLVSFSCTVPFVGGLLAATTRQEWTWPVLGMLIFSATFALPFVFFALFPRGLAALPRSGSWLSAVKVVLGFVELAAAFKFLSNADLVWGWGLLSRTLVIAFWIVIFALAGVYLLGKLRLIHEEPVEQIGAFRLVAAMLFLALPLYLIPGLLGAPLNALDAYLPPRQARDVSLLAALNRQTGAGGGAEDFAWFTSRERAEAEAARAGKPIFIDFTGYTCTNCRQMEADVFPRAEIARRLEQDFVLLRLYTDDSVDGPDLQRYQLRLTGTVALPTYAIVDPRGRMIRQWSGLASAEEFGAFLEAGAAAFRQDQLALGL